MRWYNYFNCWCKDINDEVTEDLSECNGNCKNCDDCEDIRKD